MESIHPFPAAKLSSGHGGRWLSKDCPDVLLVRHKVLLFLPKCSKARWDMNFLRREHPHQVSHQLTLASAKEQQFYPELLQIVLTVTQMMLFFCPEEQHLLML